MQKRMVISKSPQECIEANPAVLIQACSTTSSVSEIIKPLDTPKPAPEAVLQPEITNPTNFNDRTSEAWQKYYFKSEACFDLAACGGMADPDNDGLNNNEEYRFGTNPKKPDSDHDGKVDAEEIQTGRDPLVASPDGTKDKMVPDNPQVSGQVKSELYQVTNVEAVPVATGTVKMKITGKALPNTYVTIYIYSEPIVLIIKTDSDGNWSYVLDKPLEDGKHEVYVAVTDNTGKITAKSEPLVFVQSAQAATVLPFERNPSPEVSPAKSRLIENYFISIVAGIGGLLLALAAIGMIRSRNEKKKEDAAN